MLKKALLDRAKQGNYRELRLKNDLIDFSSNDYLGLARSPLFAKRVQAEWERICKGEKLVGFGSTGSRLLTGNHAYAEDLEQEIARFHGFEAALIFSSGFLANFGLLSSIANGDDIILYDMHVHASAHDGIKMSKSEAKPFRHNDPNHLEILLKKKAQKEAFVVIESLYSTDGSLAPLSEINFLCQKYQAHLLIDEAHAVGVFGKGLGFEKGIKPFAQVITFGKALGVQGAAILGSRLLRNYLINFCRTFIYSTALPLISLAAIRASYDTFPQMEKKHLMSLIEKLGLTPTHLQFFPIQGRDNAKKISEHLEESGFDIRPIFSPTVPQNREGLRICLHMFNTLEEIDQIKVILEEYA